MNEQTGHSDFSMAFAFLAGTLVGAVTGAGIALLLAPKTGEETRAQISEFARKAQEKVKDVASKVQSKVTAEQP
jgi:gas vesicle protein